MSELVSRFTKVHLIFENRITTVKTVSVKAVGAKARQILAEPYGFIIGA